MVNILVKMVKINFLRKKAPQNCNILTSLEKYTPSPELEQIVTIYVLLTFSIFQCLRQTGNIHDTCCPFCFFPAYVSSFNMYIVLLFSLYHTINHICMISRMGKTYIHLVVTRTTLARECMLCGTKGEMLRK